MELISDNQLQRIFGRIDRLPESAEIPDFVKWNEENRVVSIGESPFPGPYSGETAPHMREILRRLSPDDPCTWVSLIKSVQSTATFHSECAIAPWIKFKLGSIAFFTKGKQLARIRSSANIDPMIDNTGLADLVKPHSSRNKRKSADSTFYKEFVGGIKLTFGTYDSIADMKSNTIPFMILDEIDEAKAELGNQGDILALLAGRTMAVRNYKIFALSTPTALGTSHIHRLFMEGDRRRYFVPCPICGEPQILEFKTSGMKHGFTFMVDKQQQVIEETVGYICKFCLKKIRESKKQKMLLDGNWRPTAVARDPRKHSYHVNALYSPEMMLPWSRIAGAWAETDFGKDVLKAKDFCINYRGEAWARSEKQKSVEKFKDDNTLDYALGTVPEGALRLYGGTDIQKDRIEIAIVGVGHGFRKYLVDYRVFHGDPSNLHDPCWLALDEFCTRHTYKLLGKPAYISKVAIDCGYDPRQQRFKDWDSKSSVVYDFVATRFPLFVAVRGTGVMKTADVFSETRVQHHVLKKMYMVNTPLLKDILAKELMSEGCTDMVNFPRWNIVGGVKRELNDELIKQFLSEKYQEISKGVMGWKKTRDRNEALDVWLYAVALMYSEGLNIRTDEFWKEYHDSLVL